LKLCDKI